VEILARGDHALAQHHYAEAMSYYDELLETDARSAAPVDYRCGLCNESVGQTDKAIAAYRRSLGAAATPSLAFACHLGMARCLLRQHESAPVRRLLYPLLLDEARQQKIPIDFAADARYLVALALAQERTGPASGHLDADGVVPFSPALLDVPFYLDEIAPPPRTAPPEEKHGAPHAANPPAPPELLVNTDHTSAAPVKPAPASQKQVPPAAKGKSILPKLVRKIEQSGTALEVLEHLVSEAGLHGDWSPAAKKAVADRSLRISLAHCPVLDTLQQAADYFDLVCKLDEKTARFSTVAETAASPLTNHRRQLTLCALQGALDGDPDHPWMPAAYLELGNTEAAAGRDAEAAAFFERLARTAQGSPFVASGHFNLAQLHVHKLDYIRARQAFFRVIDHAPGHELALRAQCRIGMLCLEEENVKEAIVHLRRAQPTAPMSAYHPLATLTLAAAYLEQGQPENTRTLLAQHRSILRTDPYKPTAAFLDAYAQFRLTKSTQQNRRLASELLGTLWRDQDQTLLGSLGNGLIAQAYRDLGFWDQAERLLRRTLAQTKGPFVSPLEYLLGDTLLRQNHRDEAIGLFEKLAASHGPRSAPARFQLAQIRVQDGRFKEGVEMCRQLWAEQSLADSAPLLQVWGAALEGAGDLVKAAKCFAGKAPE
jgi:tetratricopeptide (TPR) repeat protein